MLRIVLDMRIFTQLIFVFALLFFSSACERDDSFQELRKEGIKNTPRRKDNWFDKSFSVNKEDKIDPYGDLSRDDYQDLAVRRQSDIGNKGIVKPELALPKFDDLLVEEEQSSLINDKLVSISVNEDVPVKEVLIELARRAEIDVEIDKEIEGSIIFIAKDKPFSEVIERIAKIANLRYKISDGVLQISRDTPFIRAYKFNILDISRDSQSSVTSSFQVGGGGGGEGQANINSGSTSQLDIRSGDGDMWKDIETGINEMLNRYSLSQGAVAQQGQAQNAGNNQNTSQSSILSLNKKAGLITVLANSNQHEAIKEYLDSIHISLTSQVLIEAKVLEVTLDDRYSSGINWNLLPKVDQVSNGFALGGNFGANAAVDDLGLLASAGNDALKFSVLPTELFGDKYSLDASVEFLQTFGTTRSLANPRISAMNNQYAVLNFSRNVVYFDVQLQQQQQQATGVTPVLNNFSVTSQIKTVPVGVILGLQPSIDLSRSEISMSVRPTLTRSTTSVDNPGVTIIARQLGINTDDLNSDIPVVEVRELDTVFKVKNGQIMVIGGLLEERADNTDAGLPGLADIPYIGNAFKRVEREVQTIETVIFMKASIVPGKGVSVEDKEYYNTFTSTRRKFFEE